MNFFKVVLLIGTLVGVLQSKGCPKEKAKPLTASPQLSGMDMKKLPLEIFPELNILPVVDPIQSQKQEDLVDAATEIISSNDEKEALDDEPKPTTQELSTELTTVIEQALREVQELAATSIQSEIDEKSKLTVSELRAAEGKILNIYDDIQRKSVAFQQNANKEDNRLLINATIKTATESLKQIIKLRNQTRKVLQSLQTQKAK